MKTYEIKDLLKKDLLVLELPENAEIAVLGNGHELFYALKHNGKESYTKIADGNQWKLLGKPDEIREEDAEPLVEKVMNGQHFQNYKARKEKDFANLWCRTAIESLLSLLESEIHWDVNPLGDSKSYNAYKHNSEWFGNELRTFDRSRTLIFVKQ